MTKLEMALVCFLNTQHKKNASTYEKYQKLHHVKYQKEMPSEYLRMLRSQYDGDSIKTAYELKTYYMENGMLSNTIVLKMRPKSPNSQKIKAIKIHSELKKSDQEYSYHAIEVFKEHGKYKVFDILHSDRSVWLESYLDNVCITNRCPRQQLRYDMAYLAPCHAFADNMQELSDLMRYLDKTYGIGKPRLNMVSIQDKYNRVCEVSDEIIMDFDAFGWTFGVTGKEVIAACKRIYDILTGIRFNILHLLCLGHVMNDLLICATMEEALFDDRIICEMLEFYMITGRYEMWEDIKSNELQYDY